MPSELSLAAASLKRFDTDELSSLSAQLNVYQVLRDEEVPSYNEKIDRMDHYWRAVFQVIDEKLGEEPKALVCQGMLHSRSWKWILGAWFL